MNTEPARGSIPGLATHAAPARGNMPTAALPPGVYFGLPFERYLSDPALGSSDIRLIRKSPQRYWRQSPMNPQAHLYRKETRATVLGTALHCMVLDGEKKFRDRYVRRPDDPTGSTPGDKGALTKAAKGRLLSHQTLLHGDEWDLCTQTEDLITEHPDLADALDGGENEVSVFWKYGSVRCKARYDRLKPRGIGDIKTIANEQDKPLHIVAIYDIKGYRYDIQAALYLEGRRHFPKFVDDGFVYSVSIDGIPERSAKSTIVAAKRHQELAVACAAQEEFGFQWIFIQKSMPDVWSCTLMPANPICERARNDIGEALTTYATLKEKFGSKKWPATWRLQELAEKDMPGGEWGWS